MSSLRRKLSANSPEFLDGQVLLAMPGMQDSRFARSLIYMCAHSSEGAMGIVINQRARKLSFPDLLVQLNVVDEKEAIRLPAQAGNMPVLKGGPMETARGFVLHSADFFVDESTLPIADDICLTATVDILRAIASGTGPDRAMLALGYAQWAPGQLESEMRANVWLNSTLDEKLIFDSELDGKYDRAMRLLGIDPAMLSSQAGRA